MKKRLVKSYLNDSTAGKVQCIIKFIITFYWYEHTIIVIVSTLHLINSVYARRVLVKWMQSYTNVCIIRMMASFHRFSLKCKTFYCTNQLKIYHLCRHEMTFLKLYRTCIAVDTTFRIVVNQNLKQSRPNI